MNKGLVVIEGSIQVGSLLKASLYDFSGYLLEYSSVLWYGIDKLPTDPNTWLTSSFVGEVLLSDKNTLYVTNQTNKFIKCIIDGIPSQLIIIPLSNYTSSGFSNLASSLDIFGKGMDMRTPLDPLSRSARVATDIDRINQSLYLILTTSKGEIPMIPDFGSDIAGSLFNLILPEDLTSIELSIRTDIASQEPRIQITNLDIEFDELTYTLRIAIDYNIINTNIGSNFIYSKVIEQGGEF